MTAADRPEGGPPSLAMVAAGGVGVLVVIAFVAAMALGGRARPAEPGERVAIGRADEAGTLAVFVPRCRDERVTVVEVADAGSGAARWRIVSPKGSIDERYVVGAEPPLGFEAEVPLEGALPDGELRATVTVDGDGADTVDGLTFRRDVVPTGGSGNVLHGGDAVDIGAFQARALDAADCPESSSEIGLTTGVFGVGGLVVVGTYLLMVSRWWRGRGAA